MLRPVQANSTPVTHAERLQDAAGGRDRVVPEALGLGHDEHTALARLGLVVTACAGEDRDGVLRAGGSGDITPPDAETRNEHVVWYDRLAGGTYLPTPVIYRNALYVLNDKGIFSRHNAETGERIYRSRVAPGASTFTASPWAYKGHVFVMSEEGDTFVIHMDREALGDFDMGKYDVIVTITGYEQDRYISWEVSGEGFPSIALTAVDW